MPWITILYSRYRIKRDLYSLPLVFVHFSVHVLKCPYAADYSFRIQYNQNIGLLHTTTAINWSVVTPSNRLAQQCNVWVVLQLTISSETCGCDQRWRTVHGLSSVREHVWFILRSLLRKGGFFGNQTNDHVAACSITSSIRQLSVCVLVIFMITLECWNVGGVFHQNYTFGVYTCDHFAPQN